MELEIKYNPSYWDGLMGTAWRYTAGWIMKSNLGKNKTAEWPARLDDIFITIHKCDENFKRIEPPVSTGGGSWLSHLEIDGKELWRVENPLPTWNQVTFSSEGKTVFSD